MANRVHLGNVQICQLQPNDQPMLARALPALDPNAGEGGPTLVFLDCVYAKCGLRNCWFDPACQEAMLPQPK